MSESKAPVPFDKQINEFGRIIRGAIIRISEKSPNVGRATLDQYLQVISPSLCGSHDTRFPVNVRPNPHNPERCAEPGGRFGILAFHVGNTILAYYAACIAHEITTELRRRTAFLALIGDRGLDKFKVAGDIRTGFYLFNEKVQKELEKIDGVQPEPTKPNKGVGGTHAGGRGSQAGPPSVHGRPGQGNAQ